MDRRLLVLYGFWFWTLAPLATFWIVARHAERRKEDWAVVVAFTISFVATLVQYQMVRAGMESNLIVSALYPVPQVAILAYGLMDRWPSWRPWITAMSISVSGVVALFATYQNLFPEHPEFTTLGAVSVIVLWLAWARKDLGLMKWSLVVAFGLTLPGVIAYGRAATASQQWSAFLAIQIPFAVGVLLACIAIWRMYRLPTEKGGEDLPPPFGVQVMRMLMTTGRAS